MKALTVFKISTMVFLLSFYNITFANYSDNAGSSSSVKVDTTTSEATSTAKVQSKDNLTPEDDKLITQSVESEISKSDILSKLPVTVVTKQGVVIFSGNVDSDSQASSLIEIAQSVVGVKNIDADKLKVEHSTQPFKDMMITAKIKGLLIREDVFGTKDISSINLSVETKDGIVYLTGVVNNPAQIENAKKIIRHVSGVKKVEYIVKEVKVNE